MLQCKKASKAGGLASPVRAKAVRAAGSVLAAALLAWLATAAAATAAALPDAGPEPRPDGLARPAGEAPPVAEAAPPGCRLATGAASLLGDLRAVLDDHLVKDALGVAGEGLAALGRVLDREAAGRGLAALRRETRAFLGGLDRTVGPASPLWDGLARMAGDLGRRTANATASAGP
jgi:hypothetical protein